MLVTTMSERKFGRGKLGKYSLEEKSEVGKLCKLFFCLNTFALLAQSIHTQPPLILLLRALRCYLSELVKIPI